MDSILVLVYAAMVAIGVLWWWRSLYVRWSDRWVGPGVRHWLLARKLAVSLRFGATVAFMGALVFGGVLMAAGREHDAGFMMQLLIVTFPGLMVLHVLAVALDGPSSARASDRACFGVAGRTDSIRYSNRDRFQLVVEPIAVVGLVGLLVSVAAVSAMNTEKIPPAVSCGAAAALLLLLLATLFGSAVAHAEIEGGRIRGQTILGFRRFDYDLKEVQISYRSMLSPARELLLVSRMGRWPVAFSSKATGYELVSQTLFYHVTHPC